MPPKIMPQSLAELYRTGGPQTYIEASEKLAGDQEARFWLSHLENRALMDTLEVGGFADSGAAKLVVEVWIKELRRRLRLKVPLDVVRAQTRERVRRHRIRKTTERG